jgi:hypothetical protein
MPIRHGIGRDGGNASWTLAGRSGAGWPLRSNKDLIEAVRRLIERISKTTFETGVGRELSGSIFVVLP